MERIYDELFIEEMIDQGFLLSPNIINELNTEELNTADLPEDYLILDGDLPKPNLELLDITIQTQSESEMHVSNNASVLIQSKNVESAHKGVKVLRVYQEDGRPREVQEFVGYFRKRYQQLAAILQGRPELANCMSINRLISRNSQDQVSFIGMVFDKRVTKQGGISLQFEDLTGVISAYVGKDSQLQTMARDICYDEVLGVVGTLREGRVYIKQIVYPDVMIANDNGNKWKNNEHIEEGYAIFLSDIHVGSKKFLREEFTKMIEWLNGEYGGESLRELGKKVKYIFFVGDLVDGVGVYPGQEKELEIPDLKMQYAELARLLGMIRKDITLIISPGNHDATRAAEPMPTLDIDYCEPLYRLQNAIFVTNPSLINVHASQNFPGVNVLLYHGSSFQYYLESVQHLRENRARLNPRHMMKFLLQRRHLAPSHGCNIYVPNREHDSLVIDKIPDVFVCGDLHRSDVAVYNGVTMINCSCWQSKTSFQEKTGNEPDPGKVCVMDLRNKHVAVIPFYKEAKSNP